MFEQLLYGQVNPQHMMTQLGNPQLGGLGSYGINPQLAGGLGGVGGVNPTLQFGTPSVDPITAAYLQQQLAHQALLGGGISPQWSPWAQVSPFTQMGPGMPYGQTSPWGQQVSPYTQVFGQTLPWGGQISPYLQTPFTGYPLQSQISPFSQLQQNPLLTHLQATLAGQYLSPLLSQQQLGRIPFGISPFTQQLGPQGLTGGPWLGVGRTGSPFGQSIGIGGSPYQTGFGGLQ